MVPHDRRPWYEPYLRLGRALIELTAHLLMVSSVLSGIKILELFVHRMRGTDYLFFGTIKLKYFFDISDLATLVVFLIWGVNSVVSAYIRKIG